MKPKEAVPKSPGFMTPTFASKQAESGKVRERNIIPTVKPKVEESKLSLKSAAKRVGFRREVDGTPRSKECSSNEHRVVSFPDKVCSRNVLRRTSF